MRGGGRYMRIIRAGLRILSISNLRTEFEYVKHMLWVVEVDTYTQTPPPALDMRSHLIMEKQEILISLSSIPHVKTFHIDIKTMLTYHINQIILFFLFLLV